jgi:uncharacterized membrane protein YhaH (DUF805 family)
MRRRIVGRAVSLVSLLFSFRGRINRAQYWLGSLGVGVGAALATSMAVAVTGLPPGGAKTGFLQEEALFLLIVGAISLLTTWCSLALQVKRFHDRGQSGWLSLAPFVPLIGLMSTLLGAMDSGASAPEAGADAVPYLLAFWAVNLAFFINLGCLGSVSGPNKYGDPPGTGFSRPFNPAAASDSRFIASASSAIDRAVQAQSRAATLAPKPPTNAPSFGRRATQ